MQLETAVGAAMKNFEGAHGNNQVVIALWYRKVWGGRDGVVVAQSPFTAVAWGRFSVRFSEKRRNNAHTSKKKTKSVQRQMD